MRIDMICDKCVHVSLYRAGADEYPHDFPYCRKDHWVGEGEGEELSVDPWKDCEDFEPEYGGSVK